MKYYIRLLRLFAKTSVKRPQNARDWWQLVGIGLAVLVGFGYIVGGLFALFYLLFSSGIANGMETQLLATFFLIIQAVSLVLGLRVSYGLFSGARDLPFLLSLPIPHRTVFAARATGAYLSELGTQALFLLPVTVAYLLVHGTVASWIGGIVALLLAPAIPLCVSSLLTLLAAHLFRGRKRGEMVATVLVLLLSLGFSLGIQLVSRRFAEDHMTIDAARDLFSSASVFLSSAHFYPPAVWAAQSLTQPLGTGLWLTVAVNAAALTLFVWAGNHAYRSGIVAQGESTSGAKKRNLQTGQSGVIRAIMRTELRCLLRSPVYATNLLSVVIMGPFMLLLTMFGATDELFALAGSWTEIAVFLGLFGLTTFLSTMNFTFATTLSREGAAVWILQMLPATPSQQLAARFLFSSALSAASALAVAIVAPFLLPISLPMSLLTALLSLLAGALPSFVGAIPDLYRPKLGWSSEREAVKNNFNVLLGMLVGILLLLPQVVLIPLALLVGLGVPGLCAVTLGISAIEIVVLWRLLPVVANEAFRRLRER